MTVVFKACLRFLLISMVLSVTNFCQTKRLLNLLLFLMGMVDRVTHNQVTVDTWLAMVTSVFLWTILTELALIQNFQTALQSCLIQVELWEHKILSMINVNKELTR
jgi:hypothetical protein